MKAIIQRVTSAKVKIRTECKASIKKGLLLLLGIGNSDSEEDILWLCKKIVDMRIFDDNEGIMNRSVKETAGEIIVVSQFTLMARTKKGNRPSYIDAAPTAISRPLYESFIRRLSGEMGKEVQSGIFGADMQVELTNDGPVTIILDSKQR